MMKKYQYIIIGLSFFGIAIQLLTSMTKDPFSVIRGLTMFRYFTLQSNLIVLLYFVLLQNKKLSNSKTFNDFLPGIVIYISITFLVFATMLQGTYEITGINILGNYLVHYIVPILSIVYLYLYGRGIYTYKDIFRWMIYPIAYIIFLLLHGTFTNDYLYPFFNLNNIAVITLIITIVILVLLFLLLSFIVVKILSKKELTK